MTLINPVFSSDADLLRRISQQTFNEWTDLGTGGGQPGISDDWHNMASSEIQTYCLPRGYSASSLQQSNLINRWAVAIALWYGSQTQGNPPPEAFERAYEDVMAKLLLVSQGKLQLPGVGLSIDMRPSMSNVKIDRRFVQQKVRVQQNISTDAPTTLDQNQAIDVPTTYP